MSDQASASVVSLAGRAASLSTDLYAAGEHCQHESITSDISAVADELALTSTTLWRLNKAMITSRTGFTLSFNQDLAEITNELTLLLDEIAECCGEMQKADSTSVPAAAWFFKKGRVTKLQKHLEALKTTLVVMRTVLHHGKEYGEKENADSTMEIVPHTMSEDRAILESVFAKNHDAIAALHSLENSYPSPDHPHKAIGAASKKEQTSLKDHKFEKCPNTNGVELPPIPDVMFSEQSVEGATEVADLSRRFSKRGVRLGVHMSILDLGAHSAPAELRKKWINSDQSFSDDASQPPAMLVPVLESTSADCFTGARQSSESSTSRGSRKNRAQSLINSPAAKSIGNIIRRISLSHGDSHRTDVKGKAKENDIPTPKIEDNPGKLKKLVLRFQKPPLKTPDYNQEFENGML